ncbi:transposase fragment, IS5 family [Cupriavidus taiwanensis]|nr:transposase fragment, IS5 family [Cupriavidus taiwanensis]
MVFEALVDAIPAVPGLPGGPRSRPDKLNAAIETPPPNRHCILMADTSVTIHPVTQDASARCPPSHGTLSAMSLESLSAISGMRTNLAGLRSTKESNSSPEPNAND